MIFAYDRCACIFFNGELVCFNVSYVFSIQDPCDKAILITLVKLFLSKTCFVVLIIRSSLYFRLV